MAAKVVRTRPRDFESGGALFRATFGKYPAAQLKEDQIIVVEEDVDDLEPQFPEAMNVIVGKFRRQNYRERKSPLIPKHMTFAGRVLMTTETVRERLLPVVQTIFTELVAASPVDTGLYRRSFAFTVNGVEQGKFIAPPKGGFPFGSILGVTNVVSYASTLENPGWPGAFRKVWSRVFRRYRSKYDLRYRYLKASAVTAVGARGGPSKYQYTHPVIEVAHLNAMGGNTGRQIIRRRGPSRRKNRAKGGT